MYGGGGGTRRTSLYFLFSDINKFPLNIKKSYTVELSNSLSKIISPIITYEIFNEKKNSLGL